MIPSAQSRRGRAAAATMRCMWKPDIPSPEEVEAMFPRDVFDAAVATLDRALWIDLPEERTTSS